MTNFIIYTDTSRIFIPFKANLRSNSAMTLDIVSDKYLNIPTCDSWFYKITQILCTSANKAPDSAIISISRADFKVIIFSSPFTNPLILT